MLITSKKFKAINRKTQFLTLPKSFYVVISLRKETIKNVIPFIFTFSNLW